MHKIAEVSDIDMILCCFDEFRLIVQDPATGDPEPRSAARSVPGARRAAGDSVGALLISQRTGIDEHIHWRSGTVFADPF
jgi:hypothetical protein